ncbi:hypothetical protein EXE53_19885 [Halorubrum sp. SD626R]|uniref:hypothetical protein n=1 Tax=Halorubrum sp. SD626R TaxID=1419722 RepID=UPI0010F6BFCF|nr:hypothetical protein [Halorubrum sp. SD626R]TKX78684.1 hypothetical protein EXE53_19885 [Halorubrum sp. SD626R]
MATSSLVKKFNKVLSCPQLGFRKLNSLTQSRLSQYNYEDKGDDFFEEDWDNLIILDACRYDLFADVCELDGDLNHRYSKASSTVGFLRTNIDGANLTDTVYVTANGQIQNYDDKIDHNFHEIYPLYASEWNDKFGTVLPESVTRRTLDVAEEHPDKRLLIHYVQPHFPFIGADTSEDKQRVDDVNAELTFWERVACGQTDLSKDELWNAYHDTLIRALPHVERVIDSLSGKTVVTADHGNMFGERSWPIPVRVWGHPDRLFHDPLVKVPWFVCEYDDRKSITSDPPKEINLHPDPAVVEERLKDLGYK